MAHQTDTKQPAGEQLSVQQSAPGLTVVHSASQPTPTKTDGLQVVIRPGTVYTVEADPPATARVGCHRRPTPIKPPRAQRAGHPLATLASVALIFAGVAVIAWTMAHQ